MIRFATHNDLKAISEIEAECYPENIAASLKDFEEYFFNPKHQKTIIVEDQDGIVAFLRFLPKDKSIDLWNVAVKKSHRQLRSSHGSLSCTEGIRKRLRKEDRSTHACQMQRHKCADTFPRIQSDKEHII